MIYGGVRASTDIGSRDVRPRVMRLGPGSGRKPERHEGAFPDHLGGGPHGLDGSNQVAVAGQTYRKYKAILCLGYRCGGTPGVTPPLPNPEREL